MTAINRSITGPHCRGKGLLFTVAGAAMLASFPLCTSASAAVVENAPTFGNAPPLSDSASLDNPPSSGAHEDYLLAGVMPVSDAELSKYRGGFSIGNLNVSFGFSVSTAIRGPHMHPFTVTNNFTVDHPGHVKSLGSQVSYGNPHSNQNPPTNSLSVKVASNKPSDSNYTQPTADHNPLPSPDNTVLASNTINQSTHTTSTTTPHTTTTSSMHTTTPVLVHPENSLNKYPSPGVQLQVNTSHGILTTIKNRVNGLTFTSRVDLNYSVNNYHAVVSDARRFLRAANLADQMLSMHNLGN